MGIAHMSPSGFYVFLYSHIVWIRGQGDVRQMGVKVIKLNFMGSFALKNERKCVILRV